MFAALSGLHAEVILNALPEALLGTRDLMERVEAEQGLRNRFLTQALL